MTLRSSARCGRAGGGVSSALRSPREAEGWPGPRRRLGRIHMYPMIVFTRESVTQTSQSTGLVLSEGTGWWRLFPVVQEVLEPGSNHGADAFDRHRSAADRLGHAALDRARDPHPQRLVVAAFHPRAQNEHSCSLIRLRRSHTYSVATHRHRDVMAPRSVRCRRARVPGTWSAPVRRHGGRRRCRILRELGDRRGQALALRDLGDALQAVGRPLQAGTAWREALSICETLRIPEADEVRTRLENPPIPGAR